LVIGEEQRRAIIWEGLFRAVIGEERVVTVLDIWTIPQVSQVTGDRIRVKNQNYFRGKRAFTIYQFCLRRPGGSFRENLPLDRETSAKAFDFFQHWVVGCSLLGTFAFFLKPDPQ
jgi:hypothetical protein